MSDLQEAGIKFRDKLHNICGVLNIVSVLDPCFPYNTPDIP